MECLCSDPSDGRFRSGAAPTLKLPLRCKLDDEGCLCKLDDRLLLLDCLFKKLGCMLDSTAGAWLRCQLKPIAAADGETCDVAVIQKEQDQQPQKQKQQQQQQQQQPSAKEAAGESEEGEGQGATAVGGGLELLQFRTVFHVCPT